MKSAMALMLAGLVSVSAAAAVNQSQAREACEAQVQKAQAEESDFRFRRNAMSNYRRGNFTLMFNYRAQAAGETVSRKVKCVVAKESGEVTTLEIDSGRWNF